MLNIIPFNLPTFSIYVVSTICILFMLALSGVFGRWTQETMVRRSKYMLDKFNRHARTGHQFYRVKLTTLQKKTYDNFTNKIKSIRSKSTETDRKSA
jgi:hypothetical protein